MADFEKRDPEEVKTMFAEVAKNYDKINRAMCFGLDVLWRNALADSALSQTPNAAETPQTARTKKILDIACGSGDVALALAKKDASAEITAADFCPEMLEVARAKIARQPAQIAGRITTQRADCLALPFAPETFDAATISFGFRNFQNREKCLEQINTILKRGGKLAVLEVSRARGFFGAAQHFFMGRIVPDIAAVFGGNKADYEYLANTTLAYPLPEEVENMFRQAGFGNVETRKFGCGLVALTTGIKQ